jgi:hypothetical protein
MREIDGQEFFIVLQFVSTCSLYDARRGKRDSSRRNFYVKGIFAVSSLVGGR